LDEAEMLFRDAEVMQKEDQPEYPQFYSLRGYQYCDLLLTQAGLDLRLTWIGSDRPSSLGSGSADLKPPIDLCRDVQKRAAQTLEWESGGLLDIALGHLSLGRASLLEHVLVPDARSPDPAFKHLNAAVDGLRRADRQDRLPRGLLARSALWRVSGDLAGAAHDLAEARELAERSGMKLFQVDCLIEEACQLIQGSGVGGQDARGEGLKSARECVAKAAQMIEETGYHRRDPEIRLLEQILANKS